MAIIFDSTLLTAWCSVYRSVVQERAVEFAQALQGFSPEAIALAISECGPTLNDALKSVAEEIAQGASDPTVLLRAYACLLEIQEAYKADPMRHFGQPPIIESEGKRYLLLPWGERPIAAAVPESKRFRPQQVIGYPELHGLEPCWKALARSDQIDWKNSEVLDGVGLSAKPVLRVGIVPFVNSSDLNWQVFDDDLRGPDRKAPLRCLGPKEPADYWKRLETLLELAYQAGTQILLLPELSFDEELERRTVDWLRTQNLPAPVLQLLITGSRHLDREDGFVNRYLALGAGGDPIWEQEKGVPFTLSGNEQLCRLHPGCKAEKAFEPLRLGTWVALLQTRVGRLLGPICLDYIEAPIWAEIGADLYLVPAMSQGLPRFHDQAKSLGNRHLAASIVCNADTGGERDNRIAVYLPTRDKGKLVVQEYASNLFTFDVDIV